MKTITQYREDIQALMAKSADIDTQATAQNRDLTEAEVALKNDILDRVEEITKSVQALERQERLHASLSKPQDTVTVPKKDIHIDMSDSRSRDRFSSFGEQLVAVRNAGLPGGHVDPRLFNAASGLNETTPSDGGFLVQQDFSSVLLQDIMETGVLASRCRQQPISGNANSIKINGVDETSRASTRFGGIVGYWEEEASEKTSSKPKFRKIELSLKKLIGLCYATDELLDDAAALGAFIDQGFRSEFGFLVDEAIVNGSGAGQPLGILNSPCLVSVSKEAGQGARTILAENVINMYSRMFASSRANAVWLINQDIEPQLFTMSLAVGTGGIPIYMPAGGLSGLPYGTLFGRPVLPIEHAATLGTQGDIIFADLNGYILAQKNGVKADTSIHVRFAYDETAFRFVLRIDGQPVRSTPLTPAKGSNTLSHFVALATRS
jgi:HK97 family phage major capsid protein